MNDAETNNCKRCCLQFHPVKLRRHHCRACGFLVCDNCSKSRIKLTKNNKKSRVCDECFNRIAPRHLRTSTNSSMIRSNNSANERLQESDLEIIRDSNYSNNQRTNTDGTLVEYADEEHRIYEYDEDETNESSQPLLSSHHHESRCCKCIVL